MIFLIMRPTWCYSISLLFTFFTIQILLCGAEYGEYNDCSHNFTCGSTSVSYPFWGNGRQKYCGHEGFELMCQEEDRHSIYEFENNRYVVLKINQSNHIMTIARSDLLEDACLEPPAPFFNTTIDYNVFDYALGVKNITVYYGCIDPSPSEPMANKFPCSYNASINRRVGFFVSDSESNKELQPYINTCSVNIQVPVLPWVFEKLTRKEISLEDALRPGFDIDYRVNKACLACRSSGGFCGSSTSSPDFACYCQDKSYPNQCPDPGSKNGLQKTLIGVVIVGTGLVLSIMVFFLIRKKQLFSKGYSGHQDIEDFIRQYESLAPKRYKYSEVKRMTNSFKNKLGQGGYGIVYKGMLQNGSSVAVKILNTSKQNGEDFINEVASISRTSHVNIVTLLGFCFEGKRRALIYEFMANGSLDKFIHSGTNTTLTPTQLGWEKLCQIAVGIARGLEYLHRGCNTRILHFDIKPHNILLDEEFLPKISDFGLAKLCLKKESIVSMMIARGTIGYIAPEVFNRNFGGVSAKSDVYSYGMLVLEMIGVRKKTNVDDDSSELYFPYWIYKRLELSQDLELYGNLTSEESEILTKMTIIGLWCIQMKPSERPSMSKVIEMFEGSVEVLQIPPKPFFTSPPRVIEGSSSTSAFLMVE